MVSPKRFYNFAMPLAVVLAAAAVRPAGAALAQATLPDHAVQNFETRTSLQERARLADAKGDKGESYVLHYRLDHGDFQEGDRVFVRFQQGTSIFADTLVVRDGKRLELPQMGDLSLEGVLRSELVPKLSERLKAYLRDPTVAAVPLVRVGLLGNVARPGYYYVPADMPLNDVLMRAGGPTPNSDLGKVTVRRLGDVLIDANNTRTALREGMSVDLLSMQAGDEIEVGEKTQTNWGLILPLISTAAGLIIAYTARHH